MRRTRHIIYTTSMLVIGAGLVWWATSINDSGHQALQLAAGGTLLGAAASQFTSMFINDDLVAYLTKSLSSSFLSKPTDLEGTRERFHHYHITEVASFVWRHALLDFRACREVSRLTARVAYIGKDDCKAYYRVEGGLRDDRLVLFYQAEKRKEPTVVEIYPYFAEGIEKHICGICITKSWESSDIISRCILSRKPINGWKRDGNVDEETSKALNKEWERGIHHNREPLCVGIPNEDKS
jgi:hypothetical protein